MLSNQLLIAIARKNWTTTITHQPTELANSVPLRSLTDWSSQRQSYLTTYAQSACLSWCQAIIWGPRLIIFSFSFSLKWYLDSCGFVITERPFLTRGRVCNLQLLLGLASAVFLGFKFCRALDQILLSLQAVGNQFTPHNLSNKNHERRVEAGVQALLEAVDNELTERLRLCHL
jgi:hypothetical protein